jgi:hypothetical protein
MMTSENWKSLHEQFEELNSGDPWLAIWMKLEESVEHGGMVVHLETGAVIHWTAAVTEVFID